MILVGQLQAVGSFINAQQIQLRLLNGWNCNCAKRV